MEDFDVKDEKTSRKETPKEKLTKQIQKDIKKGNDFLSRWWNTIKCYYDMYAGEQWAKEDKTLLRERERPVVTFNRVARTVNAIAGMEVDNRHEIKFLPRNVDDQKISDTLNQVVKWVRDNADAEDEESEAFIDMLICGMGWNETRIDFISDPEGQILTDRIDPFDMIYDPSAKKRNLVDSRFRARKLRLSTKEFKQMFPKQDVFQFTAGNDVTPQEIFVSRFDQYAVGEGVGDSETGEDAKIIVYQYQWFSEEEFVTTKMEGRIEEISTDMLDSFQVEATKRGTSLEEMGIKTLKRKRRKYHQVFFANNKILNPEDEKNDYQSPINDFSFQPMTGFRDRNNNYWFGLVHLMSDPQRWANKWLSQILYIIDTNAKGGLMAEADAFENPAEAEESWAHGDSITWLNPGGMGKISEKQPIDYPASIDRLLQYAITAINDTVGVNVEMLGQTNRNQPAFVEFQRREQSITIMSTLFKSLRNFRKHTGRVLSDFIRKYLSDGRMLRITGPQGAETVPLLNIPATYKFDVTVDESPFSRNAKNRIFSTLMELVPALQAAGIRMPPETMDYLPLPATLIEKMKAANKPQQPDPQQLAIQQEMLRTEMMQRQLQLQSMDLDNKQKLVEIESQRFDNTNKATDSVLNLAKASREEALAVDEHAQAAQKMGLTAEVEAEKMRQKEQAMLQEQARKDVEFLLEQRRKDLELIAKENRGGNNE